MRSFLFGARWGVAAGALAVVTAIALGAWYALWVPGRSADGPLPVPTSEVRQLASALRGHVEAISSTARNRDHPEAYARAALTIERHFSDLGYEVLRQDFETSDGFAAVNLWTEIRPRDQAEPEWLIVGAHYDSAGFAPGANDNGSGTAAVLELARLLKGWSPARLGILLVLFANEEPPYFGTDDMGSRRMAMLLSQRKAKIAGMISLETIGWFDDRPGSQEYPPPLSALFPSKGNFVAFVAMPGSRSFLHEVLARFRAVSPIPSIGGVAPGIIPGIDWSDHASFADRSIPALMVTDTALFRYPHYHKRTDTPDKVDYDRLALVTLSMAHVVRELAR